MILNAFLKGSGLSKAGFDFDDPQLWSGSASFFGAAKDPVTGKQMTEDDVFACSVMWRGLNLIADSIAKTTLELKRKLDRGNEVVNVHPALRIIDTPTDDLTWFNYVHTKVFRYFLYGNAYDEILKDGNGSPARLSMLHPAHMKMFRTKEGNLEFHYFGSAKPEIFPSDKIHWVRGPSVNGLVGMSTATYAAKSIQRLRAYDEYSLKYFLNDSTPPILLKSDKVLSKEAKNEIRRAWEGAHRGIANAFRVGILDSKMEAELLRTNSNRDAELTEQQRTVIADIARFLGVPLHMLAELTRSTNNNISTQSAEFLYYCLDGILTNFQQSYTRDLLRPDERRTLYFEHNVSDLLWANPAERREHVGKLVSASVLTPNEGREEIGKPPLPGGDVLLVQGAMVTLDGMQKTEEKAIEMQEKMIKAPLPEPGAKPSEEKQSEKEEKKPAKKKEKGDDKKATLDAFEPLFRDIASRLTTRVVNDLPKQELYMIANWHVPYYANKHMPDIKQAFREPLAACLRLLQDERETEDLVASFAQSVYDDDKEFLEAAHSSKAFGNVALAWRQGKANVMSEKLIGMIANG